MELAAILIQYGPLGAVMAGIAAWVGVLHKGQSAHSDVIHELKETVVTRAELEKHLKDERESFLRAHDGVNSQIRDIKNATDRISVRIDTVIQNQTGKG